MMRRAAILALLLATGARAGAASFEARVATPAGLPVLDAAVVLEPLVPTHARSRAHATIEQRGSEFIPYVTVVQVGTAIDFPNNDTTRHHVYSFSPPKRFEIKLYVGKPGQPVVFDKPGEVAIGCNIHDWMESHVLVVESPYFAKTAADGRALVANVPAGRYRLRLWHPLQKAQPQPQSQPIEVEIGASPLRLNLALDVRPREPRPHTDADPDHY